MRPVPVQVQELLARLVKPVDIADALRIVDDSGVADVLEAEMPQVKGRPRLHSWRAILALYVLSAIRQEGEAHVFHAQKVWWGLTEAGKTRLGFSADLKHSTMDKYLNDLVQATSESVHPLTGEVLPPRVSVDSLELMNRLLRAAVRGVKESPTQSIDSMPLETWSRRRGYKRDLRPLEEFADYGEVKRPDGNPVRKVSEPGWPIPRENGEYQPTLDPYARDVFIGSKNLAPSRIGAGFDCHIAADANALGQEGWPQFPRAILVVPGNFSKKQSLLDLVDVLASLGAPLDSLSIDRGYTQLPGLGLELSRRRLVKSLKLKGTQHGPNGSPIPGTVMIDGDLFVDWMPKDLWHLPQFPSNLDSAGAAELAARYDQRLPYLFTPKGAPNWERGTQQVRGPAATGKVSCANHPGGTRVLRAVACPSVAEAEAGRVPKPCACGAQPTLGPEDDLDLRQRFPFGTTKWLADYSRRNSVEGNNANLSVQIGSLGTRKSVRVWTSIGKRAWMTCFGVISVAIHLIRSRFGRSPSNIGPDEVLDAPLPRPQRKNKNGAIKRTLNAQQFARRPARRKQCGGAQTERTNRPPAPPGWTRRGQTVTTQTAPTPENNERVK